MKIIILSGGQCELAFHSNSTHYVFTINFVDDTVISCESRSAYRKPTSRIMPKTRETVDAIEGNNFFSTLCDIYFNSSAKKISKDYIKEMVSEERFNTLLLSEKFTKLGYETKSLSIYVLSEYSKNSNWKKFLRFHRHKDLYAPYVKEYDRYGGLLENLLAINLDDLDRIIHRVKTVDNFKVLKEYFRFSEIMEMKENYINFFLKQYNEPHPAKNIFGVRAYLDRCIELIKGCKALNCSIPTGNDWLSNYVTIYRRLQAEEENLVKAKTEEASKGFAEFQNAIDLNFEDDNYKVIVPQTYSELVQEGNALRNCLAHWEWDNRLSNHFYRVVFIRNKKELNKPYIACDIFSETNEIAQYYTYDNDRPCYEAIDFKTKYQNYLDKLPKVFEGNYKRLRPSAELLYGCKASSIMSFDE